MSGGGLGGDGAASPREEALAGALRRLVEAAVEALPYVAVLTDAYGDAEELLLAETPATPPQAGNTAQEGPGAASGCHGAGCARYRRAGA